MRTGLWDVQLSARAGDDFDEIIDWTADRFGRRQANSYVTTLSEALRALSRGPTVTGVRTRPEIGSHIYTLHVARGGRRGRHFILFRVDQEEARTIVVLRILHDAMDLVRHVPPDGEKNDPD